MNASRYFIRLFTGGIDKWFDDPPNIHNLAKVFDLSDKENSVYEVSGDVEEWLAAAAHKLNTPLKNPDATSVLRIYREDIDSVGIRLNQSELGTTGIPFWDFRHRNLVGDCDKMVALVRFVVGQIHLGEDRLRRITKKLVERALTELCSQPTSRCPTHVKLICQSWKCERQSLNVDCFTSVESEMELLEFEDEVIRPGAEQLSSGDMVADWYGSLNANRTRYSQHYLPELKRLMRKQLNPYDGSPGQEQ